VILKIRVIFDGQAAHETEIQDMLDREYTMMPGSLELLDRLNDNAVDTLAIGGGTPEDLIRIILTKIP